MKKTIFIFLFFSGLALLSRDSLSAEKISLVSCNWSPYTGEALPDYGFTAEIITRAFEHAGYQVTFTILPWQRALFMTQKGEFDGVYSGYYSEEREKTYALSEPYTTSSVMLCTLKDRNIQYTRMEDLRPWQIGVVRGYVNGPEFDQADYLKKDEAASDLINLNKLMAKRVDIIVIDQFVALYHLQTPPFNATDVNKVSFLQPPLQVLPVHIMFSRAVPGYQEKRTAFNTGLAQIKENGIMEQILVKYGFSGSE